MRNLSKHLFAAIACVAIATPAMSQILYDNGTIVTHPGGMTGSVAGADRSAISPGGTIFGYGVQGASGTRIADDFTNAVPWNVTGVTLSTYQTNATASSITAASLKIWDGTPGASTLVFDSTVTPTTFSTSLTNIYRTTSTDTASSARRIQSVELGGMNLVLAPGTYFADWGIEGTLASGPWQPPLSSPNALVVGNGLQFTTTTNTWDPLLDGPLGGEVPQGVPFLVKGTVVPEPSTLCMLLLGGLAVLRGRRS